MQNLARDLRYSLRMMLKAPGFTAVAVLVLALGIGANTAVFTLINTLLLRPLPGSGTGPLVGLFSKDRSRPDAYRGFSYPNYRDIRDGNEAFANLAAHTFTLAGVTEGDTTRRVFSGVISSNYFSTLGVTLPLGRAFTLEEERPESRIPVVIASHAYWQKTGANPNIIGRTLRINATPFTIVGIAPEGFTGTTALVSPELWLPMGMYEIVANDLFNEGGRSLAHRDNHRLMLFGRLEPGLRAAAADPLLRSVSDRLERAFPAENKDQSLVVASLSRLGVSTNPQRDLEMTAASVLLGAVAGVVLLVACLNLANMMLARGAARRKEIAVRLALGGARARIIRQLLTEGMTLSLLGGAVGLLVAYASTRLLVATLTPLVPLVISVHAAPDVRVLAATLGFCTLSTLFFGLGPAWKLSRSDVVSDLKEQAGELGSRRPGRFFAARNLLVVGQIALSLTLLVAGGLFVRGALKAAVADPGFGLEGGLLVGVDPSLAGYDEIRGRQVYRALIERLRGLPGVVSVSVASRVPFGTFSEGRSARRPGTSSSGATRREGDAEPYFTIIGTGYFTTLGLPVLRGRDFTQQEEESPGGRRVAVVNEPLARLLWPNEDPIGRSIELDAPTPGDRYDQFEVVGVVPGLREDLFDRTPVPHVYVPFGQQYRANMNIHVRIAEKGEAAEARMLGALRREVRAFDERLPVVALASLRGHRDSSLQLWVVRTGANMLTAFGGVALLLAVVGVYAVKAYVVSRRTREIGIRIALGATERDVVGLILREGLALTLAGIAVGLALAAIAARLLANMLYEVSPFDPVVFVAAPLFLAAAALFGCYLPARRAATVAPLDALRSE